MKKLVAVVLSLFIVAAFAACNGSKEEKTTVTTTASPVSAAPTSGSQQNVSAAPSDSGSPTMILTTQYGQTMPTVPTTAFSIIDASLPSQQTAPSIDFSIPTGITPPDVFTSAVTTAKPTTTEEPTTKATEPSRSDSSSDETTADKSDEPTTKAQPMPKRLDVQNISTLSNHKLEITFSPDDWGTGIKAKPSINIEVIDGAGVTRTVNATLAGKDADGNPRIIIDTSELEQGTISFTIPAQFVESKDGRVYNYEYSGSTVLSWE